MKQNLSEAIDDYAAFRRSQDLSKHTLGSDRTVFKKFLSVNGNIWVHQINDVHVTRHFEVAARTRQSSSLTVDHNALHGFFAWARHTKRMALDNDPMFGRRQPKPMQRERLRVHVSKFGAMLDIAGETDARNRMAVAAGLYTLGRDSELRSLRIRDADLAAGGLHMVIQKSRLEDVVPISEELDYELRRWLTHYAQAIDGPLEPHYYLLPGRSCSPVKGVDGRIVKMVGTAYHPERRCDSLVRMVHPILEEMGIDDTGEGGHTLRRSGARALFDSLVDGGYDHALRVVQAMLHHKSMATTEKYIGLTADKRTRDQIIRGKKMYNIPTGNVITMAR